MFCRSKDIGYRRILHIPPTSVDRTMTNALVREFIKSHYGATVIEFSKLWLKRKIQLLGHIIRAGPQDPMRQVLFLPNSLIPRTEHARRVGKPRAHWLIETYADAYRESGHVDQFDINNILQRNSVKELASKDSTFFPDTPPHTSSPKVSSPKASSSKAYSRPGLRNNRCLHPFCFFLLLFLPPCLII